MVRLSHCISGLADEQFKGGHGEMGQCELIPGRPVGAKEGPAGGRQCRVRFQGVGLVRKVPV